jgi:hypothetical protein
MGNHLIRNVSGNSWKCMWCGCYFAESQADKFSTYACPAGLSDQLELDLN